MGGEPGRRRVAARVVRRRRRAPLDSRHVGAQRPVARARRPAQAERQAPAHRGASARARGRALHGARGGIPRGCGAGGGAAGGGGATRKRRSRATLSEKEKEKERKKSQLERKRTERRRTEDVRRLFAPPPSPRNPGRRGRAFGAGGARRESRRARVASSRRWFANGRRSVVPRGVRFFRGADGRRRASRRVSRRLFTLV